MNPTVWSVIKSEWIKFRTVRSTLIGFLALVVLTLGIGGLVALAIKSHINDHGGEGRAAFDPTSDSLVGLFFAQFAVGSIGALMMTSEYATASIRTTLSAVPKRVRVIVAKCVVLFASFLVVGEATVLVAFTIGQAIFKGAGLSTTLGAPGVLRSVLLAGLYLALLGLFGFSLGLIVRTTAASIIIYAAVMLIIPIITNFLPSAWQNVLNKFLPSNLGQSMMSPLGTAHSFSAWVATVILTAYVAALVALGTVLFVRRDA